MSNHEERNRQTITEMEIKMETMRAQLQDEVANVRSVLEHERNKLHQSYEDNAALEGDKR